MKNIQSQLGYIVRCPGRKSAAGFGLVEVLVSLSILALVMLGLVTLGRFAYQNYENARNRSVAYNIIQDTFEFIRNERDTNIGSVGRQWFDGINSSYINEFNPVIDDGFERVVAIVDEGGNSRKKRVTVTVGWVERTGEKNLSAVTYFTDWKSKY